MINVNGLPLNVTQFPDKTSQVWGVQKLAYNTGLHVVWQFENEAELIHIAQLKDLADTLQMQSSLLITYLPYARQDKDISNDTTFALHTFAKILNAMNFDTIMILDPHSEKALKLIKNSSAFYPTVPLSKAIEETESTLVCYPDNGALIKYSKIYPYKHIYGNKIRDQHTGNILSYELVGDTSFENVMIVDDICDGGATFKILAAKLLQSGAGDVSLFVTHGLFTKGLSTLFESGINRIFTRDGEVGNPKKTTNL